jgi:hypothetical protein
LETETALDLIAITGAVFEEITDPGHGCHQNDPGKQQRAGDKVPTAWHFCEED